jgi:ERCC4-related helicase
MVGLGTIFIAIMVVAAFLLWRGQKLCFQRAGCCGFCC